jgi:hypothetical protein
MMVEAAKFSVLWEDQGSQEARDAQCARHEIDGPKLVPHRPRLKGGELSVVAKVFPQRDPRKPLRLALLRAVE